MMYKIERAIIMAAGVGSRMRPITLDTPKALVMVNGKRMIDTIIDTLHENGIDDIYIVTGYLKEKFLELNSKYQNITFIENPYYKSCNNISSLYVAREYIENSIILDADQIIRSKDALSPFFEKSGYNAEKISEFTNEWILDVEGNKIIGCKRDGADKGWRLYSASRWNAEDGKKLRNFLEIEFEDKQNHDIYWDDIPIFLYPDEFELDIHRINSGDMMEIDSIEELAEIDESYLNYIGESND